MKEILYNYFVRKNGRVWYEYERYVREHMEEHRLHRFRHIKLLIKLNWFYRVKKGNTPYLYWDVPVEPIKKINTTIKNTKNNKNEKLTKNVIHESGENQISLLAKRKDITLIVQKLIKFDVISFDMFDTLILRNVAEPADIFTFVGLKLDIPNFKNIRMQIEKELREKDENQETTINDIYTVIEDRYGIDKDNGMNIELEYEMALCTANTYMLDLYKELLKFNKKIIVTSNMYWGKAQLKKILNNCGYDDFIDIFVSCDVNKNKKYGVLQSYITEQLGINNTYIHVGDNYFLDVEGSRCAGWIGEYYQSVRDIGEQIRLNELTSLSSSIYRGLINNKCFSLGNLNPYYEYGYVYVGYLVLGFCKWLDELAKIKSIDKFLFVSRDMYVVYKAYKYFGGKIDAEYVKASRTSTIHLSFNRHIEHFIDWHVRRRISSNNTIQEVLYELGLDYLMNQLSDVKLDKNEIFSRDNFDSVKELIYKNKILIQEKYEDERIAAKKYYEKVIGKSKNICIVDLGWKASTYSSLKTFLCDDCNMPLNMYGAMIGMEGHSFVQDLMSENKVFTYVFSSEKNKDLMEIHNANGNVWRRIYEIIFTSNEKSLLGFYMENGEVKFKYMRKEVRNDEVITGIHEGILDFVKDYLNVEMKIGIDMRISGREAYLPLFNIMKNEDYNYKLFSDFEVCFIAGNVGKENIEMFKDVVEKGGK